MISRNASAPPKKCILKFGEVKQEQQFNNQSGINNKKCQGYTQEQNNIINNQQHEQTPQTNIEPRQINEITKQNNQVNQIEIQNQNFKQKFRQTQVKNVNQNQNNYIFSTQIDERNPQITINEQNNLQDPQKVSLRNSKQEEINYYNYVTQQLKSYEKPLLLQIINYQMKFYECTLVEDITQSKIKKSNKQELPNQSYKQNKYDEILNEQNQKVMELSLFQLQIFDKNQSIEIIKTEFPIPDPPNQQTSMIKYNQIINNETEQILIQNDRQVNNSIIDAYGTYLQQEDEKIYFKLDPEQRKRYSRLFIFTSDLITNCDITGRNQRESRNDSSSNIRNKWIMLFLEKLKNFQAIQYQFQLIYQKIAFIVNINNLHWCVVELKLEYSLLIIYDSLYKATFNLENFFNEIFSKLLQKQVRFTVIHKEDFEKQNDGFSCGYYSCIALKYISQPEVRRKFVSREQIIEELRQILL